MHTNKNYKYAKRTFFPTLFWVEIGTCANVALFRVGL